MIDTYYVWLSKSICYEMPWVIISESWVTTHDVMMDQFDNFVLPLACICIYVVCFERPWLFLSVEVGGAGMGWRLIIRADAPFRDNGPKLQTKAHWSDSLATKYKPRKCRTTEHLHRLYFKVPEPTLQEFYLPAEFYRTTSSRIKFRSVGPALLCGYRRFI